MFRNSFLLVSLFLSLSHDLIYSEPQESNPNVEILEKKQVEKTENIYQSISKFDYLSDKERAILKILFNSSLKANPIEFSIDNLKITFSKNQNYNTNDYIRIFQENPKMKTNIILALKDILKNTLLSTLNKDAKIKYELDLPIPLADLYELKKYLLYPIHEKPPDIQLLEKENIHINFDIENGILDIFFKKTLFSDFMNQNINSIFLSSSNNLSNMYTIQINKENLPNSLQNNLTQLFDFNFQNQNIKQNQDPTYSNFFYHLLNHHYDFAQAIYNQSTNDYLPKIRKVKLLHFDPSYISFEIIAFDDHSFIREFLNQNLMNKISIAKANHNYFYDNIVMTQKNINANISRSGKKEIHLTIHNPLLTLNVLHILQTYITSNIENPTLLRNFLFEVDKNQKKIPYYEINAIKTIINTAKLIQNLNIAYMNRISSDYSIPEKILLKIEVKSEQEKLLEFLDIPIQDITNHIKLRDSHIEDHDRKKIISDLSFQESSKTISGKDELELIIYTQPLQEVHHLNILIPQRHVDNKNVGNYLACILDSQKKVGFSNTLCDYKSLLTKIYTSHNNEIYRINESETSIHYSSPGKIVINFVLRDPEITDDILNRKLENDISQLKYKQNSLIATSSGKDLILHDPKLGLNINQEIKNKVGSQTRRNITLGEYLDYITKIKQSQ